MAEGIAQELRQKRCKPCEGGVEPLKADQIQRYLDDLPGWESAGKGIARTFDFKDFHQTMAFANAVAWIAHQENHHPDMELHYKQCVVRYQTHAIGGLSENDFISAAKVNALLES